MEKGRGRGGKKGESREGNERRGEGGGVSERKERERGESVGGEEGYLRVLDCLQSTADTRCRRSERLWDRTNGWR